MRFAINSWFGLLEINYLASLNDYLNSSNNLKFLYAKKPLNRDFAQLLRIVPASQIMLNLFTLVKICCYRFMRDGSYESSWISTRVEIAMPEFMRSNFRLKVWILQIGWIIYLWSRAESLFIYIFVDTEKCA